MIRFILNDQDVVTDLAPGRLVLDYVRYQAQLTGTKIGCREGDCGACTLLVGTLQGERVDYRPVTSCLLPLGRVDGCHVVTVEGLGESVMTPVQNAMIDSSASQCGFCTPGFVMGMTARALDQEPDIDRRSAIDGNICRCTGYKSIERALDAVEVQLKQRPEGEDCLPWLIAHLFVPPYFSEIANRLKRMGKGGVDRGQSLIMGGGTDLNVQRPDQMLEESLVFSVANRDWEPRVQDGWVYVSGSFTAEQLKRSKVIQRQVPRMRDYMNLVASTPIRNMATLAGNFVNASPIGDMTMMFLALAAEVQLTKADASRWLALDELFLDYKKLAKDPLEIVAQVRFPALMEGDLFHFEKVSKRTFLDIASVNTAIRLAVKGGRIVEARLAAGGVAPIPLLLRQTSAGLIGRELSVSTARWAAQSASSEVTPISDIRGSVAYKCRLLEQLVLAHFVELMPDLALTPELL